MDVIPFKADLIDGKVPEEQLPPKADLEEGKVPVSQLPQTKPGMIISDIEDYTWGKPITTEGGWYIKDSNGKVRPQGLPNPPVEETYLYAAYTMGVQETNSATLLINVKTHDTYIVRMNNNIGVNQEWWAKRIIFDGEISIPDLSAYLQKLEAEEIYATLEQVGQIDLVLDILNGDIEGDLDLILSEISGI